MTKVTKKVKQTLSTRSKTISRSDGVSNSPSTESNTNLTEEIPNLNPLNTLNSLNTLNTLNTMNSLNPLNPLSSLNTINNLNNLNAGFSFQNGNIGINHSNFLNLIHSPAFELDKDSSESVRNQISQRNERNQMNQPGRSKEWKLDEMSHFYSTTNKSSFEGDSRQNLIQNKNSNLNPITSPVTNPITNTITSPFTNPIQNKNLQQLALLKSTGRQNGEDQLGVDSLNNKYLNTEGIPSKLNTRLKARHPSVNNIKQKLNQKNTINSINPTNSNTSKISKSNTTKSESLEWTNDSDASFMNDEAFDNSIEDEYAFLNDTNDNSDENDEDSDFEASHIKKQKSRGSANGTQKQSKNNKMRKTVNKHSYSKGVEGKQFSLKNSFELPKLNDILNVSWSHKNQSKEMQLGQIVEIKKMDDSFKFYVHYVNYDPRLDEWVDESQLDLEYYNLHGSLRQPKRKRTSDHDDPLTKVKNVERIRMGIHEAQAWYFSPYPKEVTDSSKDKTLYICEFCLDYLASERSLDLHMKKCKLRHPPGVEIYRRDNLSVFELDGCCERVYCENLCYLAKLFLDHKTLQYDVDPFLFYVMTLRDETGYHIVGYFSKEKFSSEDYNLACILTLPQFQKHGFGFLLIQFSYCLSKREKKEGTPERPLSDLGRVSYESYWRFELLEYFLNLKSNEVLISDIQEKTRMKKEDILHTLQKFDIIKYYQGQYILCISKDMIEKHLIKKKSIRYMIHSENLQWMPHEYIEFRERANYV